MKKFLFTLAAVLMAGTAFAGRVYIPDTEFTADQIGTQVWLPVYIELDNEYMNGWDIVISYPENLVVTKSARKNNAVLNQTAVTDEWGTEETVSFSFNTTDEGSAYHTIGACISGGYWDPDGDGEYEMYGACKIGPTGTFMLYEVRVQPTAEFTGGNIEIEWSYSGGFDNRNGQTRIANSGHTTVALTVEGGQEPEKTEAPVITYDENTYTVTATGNGEVKLYVNGEEVENPYTFEQTEEDVTYTVTATAQEEGKEISEVATIEVTVPALVIVPEKTEAPVITSEDNGEAVVVTATGNGHICLYWDDQLVAEGEGTATWTIAYGEDPEGEEYGISATAQEEGKEVSDYARATIFVPGKQPVVPEVTEAPVINVEITDDAYIITATGNGDVVLYVNDEAVENPYTIARPEAGEEPVVVYVYATAQEEGKEMGTADMMRIEVDPKTGDTPVDPHMAGYWIVTFDKDGNEVWDVLSPDKGDYTCIVRFEYEDYGYFNYYGGETRPNENFYIVVDGVRYGAAEDGTLCVLGEALNNPLYENENLYVLDQALGRVYQMGVANDPETGNMYVYAAVAGFVDVNEVNADKAVAGVRYFNMAGQEMQEANGMTIVVTTYTDGTTSAVKVMK